jgi:hypothetical protein
LHSYGVRPWSIWGACDPKREEGVLSLREVIYCVRPLSGTNNQLRSVSGGKPGRGVSDFDGYGVVPNTGASGTRRTRNANAGDQSERDFEERESLHNYNSLEERRRLDTNPADRPHLVSAL